MPEKGAIPHHVISLPLDENSIHIWQGDLDVLGPQRPDLEVHLDQAERERAAHFRRPLDRAHFIAGRGQLRELLAHCLGIPPAELSIAYTPHGKPFLPDYPHCHFNVAHTKNFALWAIAHGSEIGIDIEQIRPDIPLKSLIPRTLCEREAYLLNRREGDPIPLFLHFWTRKEAFLKAIGCGLSTPLSEIDTSGSDGRISLPYTDKKWYYHSLTTFPNCIASMVTGDQNHQIIRHEL